MSLKKATNSLFLSRRAESNFLSLLSYFRCILKCHRAADESSGRWAFSVQHSNHRHRPADFLFPTSICRGSFIGKRARRRLAGWACYIRTTCQTSPFLGLFSGHSWQPQLRRLIYLEKFNTRGEEASSLTIPTPDGDAEMLRGREGGVEGKWETSVPRVEQHKHINEKRENKTDNVHYVVVFDGWCRVFVTHLILSILTLSVIRCAFFVKVRSKVGTLARWTNMSNIKIMYLVISERSFEIEWCVAAVANVAFRPQSRLGFELWL